MTFSPRRNGAAISLRFVATGGAVVAMAFSAAGAHGAAPARSASKQARAVAAVLRTTPSLRAQIAQARSAVHAQETATRAECGEDIDGLPPDAGDGLGDEVGFAYIGDLLHAVEPPITRGFEDQQHALDRVQLTNPILIRARQARRVELRQLKHSARMGSGHDLCRVLHPWAKAGYPSTGPAARRAESRALAVIGRFKDTSDLDARQAAGAALLRQAGAPVSARVNLKLNVRGLQSAFSYDSIARVFGLTD